LFGRNGKGSYRLERDGPLEAETRFSFAFKLTCHQHHLQFLTTGYCGCGRHSSSTLQPSRRFNSHAFLRRLIANAELPTEELATQVAQSGILGPKPGEPAFHHLNENTPSDELRDWAIRYYETNGIDDHESLHALGDGRTFRFRRIETALLLHNLKESYQDPFKVRVYCILLDAGKLLPPLICKRRGWELLEGYHRLTAYRALGIAKAVCVVVAG
jgi:hypothetical protein